MSAARCVRHSRVIRSPVQLAMNIMNERKAPRRQDLAAAVGLAIGLTLGLSACSDLGTVWTSEPAGTPPALGAGAPQPPIDAQLSLTNTYAAHKQGYTGAGVTIAVVDSGIMPRNPTVSGRVEQELLYIDPTQSNTSIDDVIGHGTWVSQVAAGSSFGLFAGGIAPGASLVSARILPDSAPDGESFAATSSTAQLFQQVTNRRSPSTTGVGRSRSITAGCSDLRPVEP